MKTELLTSEYMHKPFARTCSIGLMTKTYAYFYCDVSQRETRKENMVAIVQFDNLILTVYMLLFFLDKITLSPL